MPPVLNDWGKLAVLLVVAGCVTILAALNVVSGEVAAGIYLVEVGYVTGNGVLARRGQAPSPVIVAHPDRLAQAVEDQAG